MSSVTSVIASARPAVVRVAGSMSVGEVANCPAAVECDHFRSAAESISAQRRHIGQLKSNVTVDQRPPMAWFRGRDDEGFAVKAFSECTRGVLFRRGASHQ
jgi:hypothetical protein